MGKIFTFGMAVIAAAALADVLAHGTAAKQAASGVSTILTPALQASAGQTISNPS